MAEPRGKASDRSGEARPAAGVGEVGSQHSVTAACHLGVVANVAGKQFGFVSTRGDAGVPGPSSRSRMRRGPSAATLLPVAVSRDALRSGPVPSPEAACAVRLPSASLCTVRSESVIQAWDRRGSGVLWGLSFLRTLLRECGSKLEDLAQREDCCTDVPVCAGPPAGGFLRL